MEEQEQDEIQNIRDTANQKHEQTLSYNKSCETAWTNIKEMGFEHWFTKFTYTTKFRSLHESKVNVVESLIEHYTEEELYDRCAYLQKGFNKCMEERKKFFNESDEPDFYDWFIDKLKE